MNRRYFILRTLGSAVAAAMPLWAQAQTPPKTGAAAKAPPKNFRVEGPVLVLGDSLSAEYGLKRGSGWVALLEKKLAQEKPPVAVRNASISGETTSGGRSRLAALLAEVKPRLLIIELGGNDALRGLPLSMTQGNLMWMSKAAQDAGARVLLLGMQVPPNYGADYGQRFSAAYEEVAASTKAALVPLFLKGVSDGPDPLALFQLDRIHPKEQAQPIMLANVWPTLRGLIK